MIFSVVATLLGGVLLSGQAHTSSTVPPPAGPDAADCARREVVAARIAELEAARATGTPFEALLARLAEIEKDIVALEPVTARTCPDELTVTGLTSRFDPIRDEIARERRRREINAKPWPDRVKVAVLENRVEIGMTREQVTASWGQPRNVDVAPATRQEQWTYSGPTYLYFTNGALAVIAKVRRPPD